MATTTPTDVDTSIPEIWAKQTFRTHSIAGFFGRFIGREGSGKAIIQKVELLNKPGDLIHIQITDPLAGAGQSGDTAQLEGNEEALATSEMRCAPVLYRHAVKVNRRANKKSILDLRREARLRLAEWGMVKMDTLRFTNFAATGTLNSDTYDPHIYVVGGPTDDTGDVDDVGSGDTLTVAAVQQIKLKLKLQHAKPLEVDGHPIYVMVTHPNTLYQLRRETEYRDWVREAEVRGKDNPFFRGATALLDGVVIYEHERVPTVVNATTVDVSKGIAFGAEAFVEALDEDVDWDEDVFDYGHHFGIAYSFATQPRRALEQNSTQVYAAATAVV